MEVAVAAIPNNATEGCELRHHKTLKQQKFRNGVLAFRPDTFISILRYYLIACDKIYMLNYRVFAYRQRRSKEGVNISS